jgi:hypothetical protein
MTQYLILSIIRMVIIHYVFFATSKALGGDATKRRVAAILMALLLGAALDGITPDGRDYERAFGYPFFFYLIANTPAALIVMSFAILLAKTKSAP